MPSSPSERGGERLGWVAWLRAGFILFHLTAITLMALPAPGGGMSRAAWRNPTVQAEFQAWTERLNGLGMSLTVDEFEDRAWTLASGFMKLRTEALRPFSPYYRYCGTGQSWRMFVAPHRFPSRLEFRVRELGRWRRIYVARDPELDWRAHELDHDRLRSSVFRYGWSQYRRHYRVFARYYGERALEDFPEADAVQVRFYTYRTLSPQEARSGMDPDGEYVSEYIVHRAAP